MPPKSVLIVDSDGLICWALRKELTLLQMDARIARTGRECLELVWKNRFDMVFLAVHLPDANGIELLRQVKRMSPETRTVVISWDGSGETKDAAIAAGAEQFLEKPFDIDTVSRLVAGAFREAPCLRTHVRYLCNFPLRLSVLAPPSEEDQYHLGSISGIAEDIGRGGMRLTTDYPLRAGQGVRIRMDGDPDPFSTIVPGGVTAEVVWATARGGRSTAGMRFLAEQPFPA